MAELGNGWYFLGVLWFICLVICWYAVRLRRPIIAKPVIGLATVITLLCILMPKSANDSNSATFYQFYQAYTGRILLLVFLFVTVSVSAALVIGYFCLTPVERIRYSDWINTNNYFNY